MTTTTTIVRMWFRLSFLLFLLLRGASPQWVVKERERDWRISRRTVNISWMRSEGGGRGPFQIWVSERVRFLLVLSPSSNFWYICAFCKHDIQKDLLFGQIYLNLFFNPCFFCLERTVSPAPSTSVASIGLRQSVFLSGGRGYCCPPHAGGRSKILLFCFGNCLKRH